VNIGWRPASRYCMRGVHRVNHRKPYGWIGHGNTGAALRLSERSSRQPAAPPAGTSTQVLVLG